MVERFIDCFRTLSGDCEDVAKAIYVTFMTVRGIADMEGASEEMRAWSAVCKLYCPTACVVQATTGKMTKDADGSSGGYMCHVCAFAVPRVMMAKMLNRGTGSELYRASNIAPVRDVYNHDIDGWEMGEMPWEERLEACVLEGTMPTCPFASRTDTYFSNEYLSSAKAALRTHVEMENRRRDMEQKTPAPPGYPRSASNPLRSLDMEVCEREVGEDGGCGAARASSAFYKRIIQMWCPLPNTERWADDDGATPSATSGAFFDMAVCYSGSGAGGSPRTYGVDFGSFMAGESALVPSYTLTQDEMDFVSSAIQKELESEIPSLSRSSMDSLKVLRNTPVYYNRRSGPFESDAYSNLIDLCSRFSPDEAGGECRVDSQSPPQAFYKEYVSYILDPSDITETLVDWLKNILENRYYRFHSISCTPFAIADNVYFAELRIHNSDFHQL